MPFGAWFNDMGNSSDKTVFFMDHYFKERNVKIFDSTEDFTKVKKEEKTPSSRHINLLDLPNTFYLTRAHPSINSAFLGLFELISSSLNGD